jgi:hypothetical protein
MLAMAAGIQAPKAAGGPLFLGGLLAFGVGGPVFHGTHGRTDALPTSLLLRLTAPVVSLLAVYEIVQTCEPGEGGWGCSFTSATAVTFALVAPLALASVIDAARASTRPTAIRPRPPDLAWTPTLAPTSVGAGATLGLVGRF